MLFLGMVAGLIVLFLAQSSLLLSHSDKKHTSKEADKMKSRYVAEGGLQLALRYIDAQFLHDSIDFHTVDTKLKNFCLYDKVPWQQGSQRFGDYSVFIQVLTPAEIQVLNKDITGYDSNSVRYILIRSIGYFPNANYAKSKIRIHGVYEMSSRVSQVFDYSYFINNWGWLYGNNIVCKGNARSNGSFSMGSYRPEIWGKPRFETSQGWDLIGYIDDDANGKQDNQDGGIYAWNLIDGTPSANGSPSDLYAGKMGQNTTTPITQVPMPNLTNLTFYEERAKQEGSSIKIGTTVVCDGILGDNETKQNLYLEGTYENPIIISGTVVVRGDVIIRGYIQGQGCIYAGRNIYVPQRVLYKNSTSERQPSSNSESSRENWRTTNANADLLGLFARENIVLSDFTSSTWQQKVLEWMNNSKNQSKEDAGLDNIPNTGDAGEGDGIWTVEKDSAGNVMPGSGEDIDGDGKYDGTTTLTAFNLASGSFFSNHPDWAGNIPSGVTSFKDVVYWNDVTDAPGVATGSIKFPQVDATLYTNHFLGGYITNEGGYSYKKDNRTHYESASDILFFGSLISRNESLIYQSSTLSFYHDDRLSAGAKMFNFVLPKVWNPLRMITIDVAPEF